MSGVRLALKSYKREIAIKTRLAVAGMLAVYLGSYLIGQAQSPRQVLDQLLKIDMRDLRLTPVGWREADALFTKESSAPPKLQVVIVANHYGVSEGVHEPGMTKFYVGYETLGKLDDQLRFVADASRTEVRNFQEYTVTLGSKRWELSPSDQRVKEITVPLGRRIEGVQPANAVNGALQYLKSRTDKSDDPSIKTNAKRSIAELEKYDKAK